jgi:hypothetical protein
VRPGKRMTMARGWETLSDGSGLLAEKDGQDDADATSWTRDTKLVGDKRHG